ncbi:MAG: 50S ribosomal protein L29 [Bacteroidia bacterium]
MKNSEIRELSDKELVARIAEEKVALTKLMLNNAVSPLENTNVVKNNRRLIARLLTEKRKRELTNA